MKIFHIILLVTFLWTTALAQTRHLEDNECDEDKGFVYSSCGSVCPKSCKNPNPMCGDCAPGCVCMRGLVLLEVNGSRSCVPKEQCSEDHCDYDKGFVYVKCGTPCPRTCNTPFPSRCQGGCMVGCVCKIGLYEKYVDNVKTCVPLEECPGYECDVKNNLVYKYCGSVCRLTCEPPKPGPCPGYCVKGCFCENGTVEHYVNGTTTCVLPENCP